MANDDELQADYRGRARLIGLVIVVGVLLWFALANLDTVKVSFLVGHSEVRLIYALAFAAFLGALADRLTVIRNRRR
jgi:uncharacterized integral membrane protein